MTTIRVVLLSALLLAPASAMAQDDYHTLNPPSWFFGHEKWFECRSDEQCKIIVTSACGKMTAVNKEYADIAVEYASTRYGDCNSMFYYCEYTVPKCINAVCVLAWPPKDCPASR